MLINKLLTENKFIFVNNVDFNYIKLLINIGYYPIFMCNFDKVKFISVSTSCRNNNIFGFLVAKHKLDNILHYPFLYRSHYLIPMMFDLENTYVCSFNDIKNFLLFLKLKNPRYIIRNIISNAY